MIIKISSGSLRLFLAALTLAMLAVCPLAGQRGWHQGDTWLKWNRESRENFLFGYMSGYSTAYGDVCRRLATQLPKETHPGSENLPIDECLGDQLDFTKGFDYFVDNITAFYKRYPGDRDIYIYEVVEQLARGLAAEQVHSHPFPRHMPSSGNK
jgi:hypothetical protein